MKRAVLIGVILVLFSAGSVYAAISEVAKPVPATITLVQGVAGDANEDGSVDALDITRVERVIATLDPLTPGADANGDGTVNAIDITKVERIIAGLN